MRAIITMPLAEFAPSKLFNNYCYSTGVGGSINNFHFVLFQCILKFFLVIHLSVELIHTHT